LAHTGPAHTGTCTGNGLICLLLKQHCINSNVIGQYWDPSTLTRSFKTETQKVLLKTHRLTLKDLDDTRATMKA